MAPDKGSGLTRNFGTLLSFRVGGDSFFFLSLSPQPHLGPEPHSDSRGKALRQLLKEFQLTRIVRACAMAELFVLRLMTEPTAVALLYGHCHDRHRSGKWFENIAALEGAVASGVSDPLGSLDLLTIQATPQSLGIEADGHTFVPIIPRNVTMPARKGMWFTTVCDNQTEALIVIYEGEGKKVEENHILGYFKIMGIPSAPKGIPEISVCMDLDAANILRVFAGAVLPQAHQHVMPFLEERMPTVGG
ncbi:hypothetical protein GIB67_025767 [Kingdonia uniflora]|uniref:Uncharacterized protein n=1 Tax=Kingdonia uniflora TaxID=39325 RepID=A0A7J7L2W3_9MAGN|nr:hypothetical protein GIB67_025767 [Kingdonia uniflora]